MLIIYISCPHSRRAIWRGAVPRPHDRRVDYLFTPEQEALFRRRVEEKIDIFNDEDYVLWLGILHPDLLPTSGGSQSHHSVATHFSSITPLTPIMEDPPSCNLSLTSASESRGSAISMKSPSTAAQSVSPTPTLSSTLSSQTVVSKFLTCPVTSPRTTPTCKLLPRARLLTSASSLAMLEEKEKKKQEQTEERERKKKEKETRRRSRNRRR